MIGARAIMALLTPRPGGDAGQMTAHRELSLGPRGAKHISGGAQMAAIIALLEQETGQPLIQASGQFLGSPKTGEHFTLRIDDLRKGKSISLADVKLLVGTDVRVRAAASLGARSDIGAHQWLIAPSAPPPDECPPLPFIRSDPGDLHRNLDIRLAHDPRGDPRGELVFWVGWNGGGQVPSAFLALIADYLPEAVHFNIGRPAGAVSLDNAIRIIGTAETSWLLCHTKLSGIANGLFHGEMAIYSVEGGLLAVAGQSGVVRLL